MSETRIVRRNRVRRTAEEWKAIVERYEGGGETRAGFCGREQIAITSLTRWRRKLRGEPAAPARFIELSSAMASNRVRAELELGQGLVLRIFG